MKYLAAIFLAVQLCVPSVAEAPGDAGREYQDAKTALAKILASEAKEKTGLMARITELETLDADLYRAAVKEPHRRKELFLQMARNKLEVLRAAIRMYFIDNSAYPPDLKKLTPKYVQAIPEVAVMPGPASGRVYVLDKDVYGRDLYDAVGHTNGGWLYVSDKNSPRWGDVYINSDRITIEGKYAYQY
ncbi:MAG: hypothetical protein PHW69_09425 [Elusimicrobiaceae bacterium]|nr:hypothetical protein [Elusimicrobiaceae bacterium]